MTLILVAAVLAASYPTRDKGAPVISVLTMTVLESTEIHPTCHRNRYFGVAQTEGCRCCSSSNENTSGFLDHSQLHSK